MRLMSAREQHDGAGLRNDFQRALAGMAAALAVHALIILLLPAIALPAAAPVRVMLELRPLHPAAQAAIPPVAEKPVAAPSAKPKSSALKPAGGKGPAPKRPGVAESKLKSAPAKAKSRGWLDRLLHPKAADKPAVKPAPKPAPGKPAGPVKPKAGAPRAPEGATEVGVVPEAPKTEKPPETPPAPDQPVAPEKPKPENPVPPPAPTAPGGGSGQGSGGGSGSGGGAGGTGGTAEHGTGQGGQNDKGADPGGQGAGAPAGGGGSGGGQGGPGSGPGVGAPPAGPSQRELELLRDYGDKARKRIKSQARNSEAGARGTVRIGFTVSKKGRLLDVTVVKTSGFNNLDNDSMEACRAAFNDAWEIIPFPKDVQVDKWGFQMDLAYPLY